MVKVRMKCLLSVLVLQAVFFSLEVNAKDKAVPGENMGMPLDQYCIELETTAYDLVDELDDHCDERYGQYNPYCSGWRNPPIDDDGNGFPDDPYEEALKETIRMLVDGNPQCLASW